MTQFYGAPSEYLWEDDEGEVHTIQQGEGGEQGDAMMPLLYCLGQHKAYVAIASQLLPNEKLFVFLDDLYFVCKPNRVSIIYGIIETALWEHARIRVHTGKTQVWNKGGVAPNGMDKLGAGAWRGDSRLPCDEQGMKILGTPVGHP